MSPYVVDSPVVTLDVRGALLSHSVLFKVSIAGARGGGGGGGVK